MAHTPGRCLKIARLSAKSITSHIKKHLKYVRQLNFAIEIF
jgi:hypothetical protein